MTSSNGSIPRDGLYAWYGDYDAAYSEPDHEPAPSVSILSSVDVEFERRKQSVCALLNDLFDIANNETSSSSSARKARLLQMVEEFSSEVSDSSFGSGSVDKRFVEKYYQHENQDTLVLTADELGEIIAVLEAENRIFVDNHEIYQI
jgi:hypothetical protein